MQRYKKYKIKVCGKVSIPLNGIYCKLSKNIEIYNGFERYVTGNITFIEINKNKTLVTTFHNQKESMTLKVDLFKLIRPSSFKQNNFSCLISFGLQNYFSKSAKFNIMCVHCTLYTVHYTLYTGYCTIYAVHWILYTIHCTLDTVQVSEQIVSGKFPVNQELAFELAALMAQVGFKYLLNNKTTLFSLYSGGHTLQVASIEDSSA